MKPTMIFTPDGKPLVAYGSPGGATIINSVLNVTLNLIDHKMTLQDAIDAPRMSVTSAGSAITIGTGLPGRPPSTACVRSGYTVGYAPGGDIGSVQAVLVDSRPASNTARADARREGTVIGLPR